LDINTAKEIIGDQDLTIAMRGAGIDGSLFKLKLMKVFDMKLYRVFNDEFSEY